MGKVIKDNPTPIGYYYRAFKTGTCVSFEVKSATMDKGAQYVSYPYSRYDDDVLDLYPDWSWK